MPRQPSFNDLYGDDAPETPEAGDADLVSIFFTPSPSPPSQPCLPFLIDENHGHVLLYL